MTPERLKEIQNTYEIGEEDWVCVKELLDYVAELEASNAAMFQGRILATERELRLQAKVDALEAKERQWQKERLDWEDKDTLEAKKIWKDLCRMYSEQLHTTR